MNIGSAAARKWVSALSLTRWASAGEEGEEEAWDTWDVRRSLFDNHMSPSFAANMEYMFKKFGFYFPDAEFLADPEGLLQYLVRAAT